MFRTVLGIAAIVGVIALVVVGSFWGMWFLAFGQAEIRGVDPFAAAALLGMYTILVIAITMFFDIISDIAASRAAVKGNETNMKQMKETLNALTAQGRALSAQAGAVRKIVPQEYGGVVQPQEPDFVEGDI